METRRANRKRREAASNAQAAPDSKRQRISTIEGSSGVVRGGEAIFAHCNSG